MFKKLFLWIISIAIVFFVSLKIGNTVHTQLLNLGDYVKIFILNTSEKMGAYWKEYFNQADEIKYLREQLKYIEKTSLRNIALEAENRHIRDILKSHENLYMNSDIHLVKVLSYAELGNYRKVWLEHNLQDLPEGKIFGLSLDNTAVGIAIVTEKRLLGVFNGDQNSVYSVYIGKNKVPGIIKTQKGKENIFANYIPSWLQVGIGDEVITSGLDGIFFEGIRVGKVVSLESSRGYFIAEIKPETQVHDLRYLWLISMQENQQIDTSNITNIDMDTFIQESLESNTTKKEDAQ